MIKAIAFSARGLRIHSRALPHKFCSHLFLFAPPHLVICAAYGICTGNTTVPTGYVFNGCDGASFDTALTNGKCNYLCAENYTLSYDPTVQPNLGNANAGVKVLCGFTNGVASLLEPGYVPEPLLFDCAWLPLPSLFAHFRTCPVSLPELRFPLLPSGTATVAIRHFRTMVHSTLSVPHTNRCLHETEPNYKTPSPPPQCPMRARLSNKRGHPVQQSQLLTTW